MEHILLPRNLEKFDAPYSQCDAANIFSGEKLLAIDVHPENQFFSSVDGVLFNRDQTALLCYPRGKTATEYTVPDSVNKIEYGAFQLSKLKTIALPEGLLEIEESAFYACEFEYITLPESLQIIQEGGFRNCLQLKSIVLPKNLQFLGRNAFMGCTELKDIFILNPNCSISKVHSLLGEKTVIHGYEESTAHDYARQLAHDFVDLNTEEYIAYNTGNTGFLSQMPTTLEVSSPVWCCITSFNSDTQERIGYQPTIVLEQDNSNETYREMLRFVNTLTENCGSQYERARVIYQWVRNNVEYIFGVFGPGFTAEGVYQIWQHRKGNCEVFTQLTNYLLYLAHIPTATVTGYGHCWSAALIDGRWILIDSTLGLFDEDPEEYMEIYDISFSVDDNIVCIIDDYTGVKLASYGMSIQDHDLVQETTIPPYVSYIYDTVFFFEDCYGTATTHLTIRGTAGSYAEEYLQEHLPHYNEYSYDDGLFVAKVVDHKDEDDAIYLLRHVLFPDMYPVEGDVDYTGDGVVTEDDAIYLLRHVLFPDLYPI